MVAEFEIVISGQVKNMKDYDYKNYFAMLNKYLITAICASARTPEKLTQTLDYIM
jgi:hypothetical protein